MFIKNRTINSQFINVVIKSWNSWLESLSLSDGLDDDVSLGSWVKWVTVHLVPMGEDALWEGSSGGGSSQGRGETERLSDWEISLHLHEWGSSNWLLTNDDTSSLGKGLIDTTNAVIWGLDLNQENWLLEFWGSSELTGVEDSSGSWDDLTSTSMDGIGVKGNIMDVESDTSHGLIAHGSLLGGPLESSFDGILDFVKELHSLSGIDNHVWSSGVWSIAPNLEGIGLVPLELLAKDLGSLLGLGLWSALLVLDHLGKLIGKWGTLEEESVMLVW